MWSFNGPTRRLQLFRRSRNTLCRPSIQGASHEYHSICASRRSRIGGGLVSTASDYPVFLEMLRNGGVVGSTRILSPKTIELMTMNHLLALVSAAGSGEQPGLGGRGGSGFGLGFAVITDVPATQVTPLHDERRKSRDRLEGCVATLGLRRQDGPPLASTVPGPPSCPATIRSNGASSNPPSFSSAFGGTCGMP